jgi:hypothetical protein
MILLESHKIFVLPSSFFMSIAKFLVLNEYAVPKSNANIKFKLSLRWV